MRGFLFVLFALSFAVESLANPCVMIDDPAGYKYLECDPDKIKSALEITRAASKANKGKPKPRVGHEQSVEEFTANMAVEQAKSDAERATAKARADVVRQDEERKRAEAARKRAAAVAKAEAEFKRAAERGGVGPWRYELKEDRMGGKTAVTLSKNEINFGFPYQGNQRATLLLRAHPRHGRDVILSIQKGQFVCGVSGCNVTVRFGAGKPQRLSAGPPDDHSSTALFIQGHDQFVANMKAVEKLLIEAPFFQEGNRLFEFDVAALQWPFDQ